MSFRMTPRQLQDIKIVAGEEREICLPIAPIDAIPQDATLRLVAQRPQSNASAGPLFILPATIVDDHIHVIFTTISTLPLEGEFIYQITISSEFTDLDLIPVQIFGQGCLYVTRNLDANYVQGYPDQVVDTITFQVNNNPDSASFGHMMYIHGSQVGLDFEIDPETGHFVLEG